MKNSNVDILLNQPSAWLKGTGEDSDIVISSRVRFARNLKKIPFYHWANDKQRQQSYSKIKEVTPDSTGKTRLFVASGRKNGLTPIKLISMLKNKVHIKDHQIQDIKVLEDFSFLTVPFSEAELILNAFLNTKKGQKSLIVKAKKPQNRKK